jgi:hypothetical protein
MAYAEIGNLALDLAAHRARLSDPAWPSAGLWRPADASTARQRRVSLRLVAGLGSLALAAEFLHPGSDRGEVIGNAGSVHDASSLLFGLVLTPARSPTS